MVESVAEAVAVACRVDVPTPPPVVLFFCNGYAELFQMVPLERL